MSQSKYYDKTRGKRITVPNTKARRKCDSCGRSLKGKRGHGFPTPNGRTIECSMGCGKP